MIITDKSPANLYQVLTSNKPMKVNGEIQYKVFLTKNNQQIPITGILANENNIVLTLNGNEKYTLQLTDIITLS